MNEVITPECAAVPWHVLEPHLSRDALLVVCSSLDLPFVATKIAQDDSEVVERWIDEGKLSKPLITQIEEWRNDRLREFLCSVVRPFVLMQV